MELKQELVNAINNLTLIEERIEYFVSKLNELDLKIQEILHYYEYNTISTNGHSSLSRELQRLRIERRNVKNLYEIYGVYISGKNKLIESGNREMLVADIFKREKTLNQKYNNKYYTNEELDKMAKK